MFGSLVDYAGRVLLSDCGEGLYRLPGGPPYDRDHDLVATLRRLVLEDAQVTLTEAVPLGYETTDEAGQPQARRLLTGRRPARAAARFLTGMAAGRDLMHQQRSRARARSPDGPRMNVARIADAWRVLVTSWRNIASRHEAATSTLCP
ncbi:hypothetical protein GCM10023321_49040 [Pseudonocardia eucalypti]|uniref:NUDIX hydrolase n=1 Tax=Pseudonocardia eucalypti TaxID=648755 RepID=A0ABP9QJE7_9PSEU